jgi:hypothetical protein
MSVPSDGSPCDRLEQAFREKVSPRQYFPEKPRITWGLEYACWRLAHALHPLHQSGEEMGQRWPRSLSSARRRRNPV